MLIGLVVLPLLSLSPDFAKQLRQVFDQDFSISHELTSETWAKRSLTDRIKEQGARLWATLL